MILTKFGCRNYGSFLEVDYEIPELGVVAVVGENHAELKGFKSNGSGKSTFLEIPKFTVGGSGWISGNAKMESFWSNFAGDKLWVGKKGKGPEFMTYVEGYDNKGISFRIERTPKGASVYKNGAFKQIASKEIPDHFGLSKDIWNNAVFINYHSDIFKLSEDQKAKYFQELSGIDFAVQWQLADKWAKYYSAKSIKTEGLIPKLDKDISNLKGQLKILVESRDVVKNNPKNIVSVVELQKKIDVTEKKTEETRLAASEIEYRASERYKRQLKAEMALERLESSLKDVKTVCPTCGQKLPKDRILDISENRKKISVLKKEIVGHEKYLEKLEEDKKPLTVRLERLNEERSDLRHQLNQCMTIQKQLKGVERQIRDVKDDIIEIRKELDTLNSKRQEYMDKWQAFKYWKIAVSPRGPYTTQCIKKSVELFCENAQTWIDRYFEHCTINATMNTKKGVEKTFYVDLEVKNTKGGDWERNCTGERGRVSLALALAANEIYNQVCPTNIIMFDDFTFGIDDAGVKVIADILTDVGKERTVFFATQDTDLAQLFKNQVKIIKDEHGVSRIAV